MTEQEWLDKAKKHADELRQFIGFYHPSCHYPTPELPITAPNAEIACDQIREEIRYEDQGKADPMIQFSRALEANDIGAINSLLNATWFGVPESTDCWFIPGFGVAVDLMGDLPGSDPTEEDLE